MPKETSRVLPLNKLRETIAGLRQGKTIVVINGCFDILHSGHLHLLNSAKNFGDVLVVAINSDKSVKGLKGSDRPLVNETERAEVLANLRAVDFVTIFDEPTASEVLKELKPDVYVGGGNYNPDNLPEAPIIASFGGVIKFVDLVPGKSSTGLINKIKTYT